MVDDDSNRRLSSESDDERTEQSDPQDFDSEFPAVPNYKLLQSIGRGGMGQVFMAEQLRPVKRRVALKVIKSDMPSKEVLARFEAERQALAMMEHHGIARVLDSGVTEEVCSGD